MVSNDPWSPLAEAQGDSTTVLGGNDAWGMPTASATASSIPALSSTEANIGANNDLSIGKVVIL